MRPAADNTLTGCTASPASATVAPGAWYGLTLVAMFPPWLCCMAIIPLDEVGCIGVLQTAPLANRRRAFCVGERHPRLSRQARPFRHRLHSRRTERHPGASGRPEALRALETAGGGREPAGRRRQPRRRGRGEESRRRPCLAAR